MVPQSKQLSPPHVLTEYSVLPQTDFFHLLCDKHIFKLAYNPYTIWGWCVTIWTVRFPSICAVGMNIQGNLSGSILCFSKGLHTAHCPSIVPIKIFWCQEHFSITTSLSILTQQVFQEHFLLAAPSNRTPTFNFYILLPSCTKAPILVEKGCMRTFPNSAKRPTHVVLETPRNTWKHGLEFQQLKAAWLSRGSLLIAKTA